MCDKWFPTKKEIKKWIDRKLHVFAAHENRNPHLLKEEWLNRYLLIDELEIFFCSFTCELHKLLSILANSQGTWKLDDPIVWTPKLVKHLEASENNITRAVNHWITIILCYQCLLMGRLDRYS